jgi:tRNA A37 threonylcarbamoyltransferase TsaD
MKLHEYPLVQDMAGGAAIGYLAREGDEKRYQLITSKYSAKMKDCSFSFGGMLSHIQRVIEKESIHYGMYFPLLSRQKYYLKYAFRITKYR